MKKNILITFFFMMIFVQCIYSNNVNWTKLEIPELQRVDQISFNSNGDIFINSWNYSESENATFRVLKSINNSYDWDTVYQGYMSITATIDSNDIYIYGLQRVLKSSDYGITWESFVDTLPISFIHTVKRAPNGCIYLGANSKNYCSKDNGKTWVKLDIPYQVNSYLFLNDEIILAGVNSGVFPDPPQYIYRSSDNGNTWEEVLIAEKTFGWNLVKNKNGHIFAAAESYDSTYGGVYKSIDNGITWSSINNGLPSREVNSLVINSAGNLFLGIYEEGIFFSSDEGDTWNIINNDLDDLRIQTLAVDIDDNLYIGTGTNDLPTPETPNAGLFFGGTTTSINQIKINFPDKFLLLQNYPNPFNPVTKIKFTIPASDILPPLTKGRAGEGLVSLRVYDILGREAATLINENITPGKHEIEFDGSNLASGIYYYTLSAGSYRETKKMLLLK
jgi:photosystem II stability/assembly factor-like uncharacterized protein